MFITQRVKCINQAIGEKAERNKGKTRKKLQKRPKMCLKRKQNKIKS